MLKLTRPLCVLDLESTGLEITRDKIVSIAIVKIQPDGGQEALEWLINPGVQMTPENIAIHGITNEMVASAFPFTHYAAAIQSALSGSDLAGFNILGFDAPMLWQELCYAGIEWDLAGVSIVDAGVIFKKMEERSLSAAVRFYCGREHTDAHLAMADTIATVDVLKAQVLGYGQNLFMPHKPPTDAGTLIGLAEMQERNRARYSALSSMTVPQLADFCAVDDRDGSRALDFAGTVRQSKDGVPVFGTKRNRGVPVAQDLGYAEWILYKADFPQQTRKVLEAVLNRVDKPNHREGELF